MTIDILKIIGRFFFLVLLQILVLNNIQFSGFINPFLYVMFILMLPFETADWLVLVSSFFLGLTIDMFSNTMGMHAAACTAMAFARKTVLKFFSPREGYEFGDKPTIDSLGNTWYFYYSALLVLVHHFVLFYIEVFRFSEFFFTFFKVILSSFFTIVLIFLSQYLMYRRKGNNS